MMWASLLFLDYASDSIRKDEGRDFRWMLRVILMRIFHPVFEPGYGDPQSPGLDRLSYPHHKFLMCQMILWV